RPRLNLQRGGLSNCRVNSIRLNESDSEVRREYAPVRIVHLLRSLGVEVADSPHEMEPVPVVTDGRRKLAQRFLRIFRRTTAISEDMVRLRFHGDAGEIRDGIIPLMERYGLLQRQQDFWMLARSLEEILRADGANSEQPLARFWHDIGSNA